MTDWIRNRGRKSCPVNPGTHVELRLRSGEIKPFFFAPECLSWEILGGYPYDIMAYRVIAENVDKVDGAEQSNSGFTQWNPKKATTSKPLFEVGTKLMVRYCSGEQSDVVGEDSYKVASWKGDGKAKWNIESYQIVDSPNKKFVEEAKEFLAKHKVLPILTSKIDLGVVGFGASYLLPIVRLEEPTSEVNDIVLKHFTVNDVICSHLYLSGVEKLDFTPA